MRVEIIEMTTIYPEVYVIKEGSFDMLTLSADVVCRCHTDTATEMKKLINNQ
jgi:hypothetical protein